MTIKSKIILLTLSISLILSLVLSGLSLLNYNSAKILIQKGCDIAISVLAEKINKEITSLQRNAWDLAIIGEGYYNSNRNTNNVSKSIVKLFEGNKNSAGGGIWFEPYSVNAKSKNFCLYANPDTKTKQVKLRTWDNNYFIQDWYKQISSHVDNTSVVWSLPYYDFDGKKVLMVTVGAGIFDDNNKLVGISTVDWEISSIVNTITQIKPTQNSFVVFADTINDFVIVSTYGNQPSQFGKSFSEMSWYTSDLKDGASVVINGKKYICFLKILDNGMALIVNVPENELYGRIFKYLFLMLGLFIFISISIAIGTFVILKNNVNDPIDELKSATKEIGNGNLDAKITITDPQEFAELGATFNKMTSDLKNYIQNLNKITLEKEKMYSELNIAKSIQLSALPKQNFDEIKEFELAASMEPAKSVGGDFYDFFFINKKQFMFLIADVSGKGVPAALFMMTTKTLVKNIAQSGLEPTEMIERINQKICENNDQGFFVTLFAIIVNVCTGDAVFINCGHNPPLLVKKDDRFEYVHTDPNLVLGAFDDVKFNIHSTKLEPDDVLFLYTDGITEATNVDNNLFGEQRLLNSLNNNLNVMDNLNDVLANIDKDVKDFVGDVEQNDDMTVLMFKYIGQQEQKISIEATLANYKQFNSWIEENCDKFDISPKRKMDLVLATEEIYTNIVNYAYCDVVGNIDVSFAFKDDKLFIKFVDNGQKYNPLQAQEPDISLPAEQRDIGGLGIFMVKNLVDELDYKYENGENILTLSINLK